MRNALLGSTWFNTGLPGYCNKDISVRRVLCNSLTEVTEVSGKGMGILQHLNNSSRYGYVSVLHNSEVPGIVAWAHRTHIKFRAGKGMLYPYPGYLWHGRTKLTEGPGTGMSVLQNLQKFFVGYGSVRTRQNITLEDFTLARHRQRIWSITQKTLDNIRIANPVVAQPVLRWTCFRLEA